MTTEPTNAEILGIRPHSLVWIVGDTVEETALLDPFPAGVETYSDDDQDQSPDDWASDTWTGAQEQPEPRERDKPGGIDTAVIAVSNSQEFHMRLDDVLPRMGSVARVWVVYPAEALPLDILRHGVDEYGWGATAPVRLDETWSAVELTQT